MKKVIGYVFLIAGIAGLALSFQQVRTMLGVTLPAGITELYLMVAGIVLLILGVMMSFRGGGRGKQASEVPIYHGKNIVGYRRTK